MGGGEVEDVEREREAGKKVPFLAFFSVLLTGLDPPQYVENVSD